MENTTAYNLLFSPGRLSIYWESLNNLDRQKLSVREGVFLNTAAYEDWENLIDGCDVAALPLSYEIPNWETLARKFFELTASKLVDAVFKTHSPELAIELSRKIPERSDPENYVFIVSSLGFPSVPSKGLYFVTVGAGNMVYSSPSRWHTGRKLPSIVFIEDPIQEDISQISMLTEKAVVAIEGLPVHAYPYLYNGVWRQRANEYLLEMGESVFILNDIENAHGEWYEICVPSYNYSIGYLPKRKYGFDTLEF